MTFLPFEYFTYFVKSDNCEWVWYLCIGCWIYKICVYSTNNLNLRLLAFPCRNAPSPVLRIIIIFILILYYSGYIIYWYFKQMKQNYWNVHQTNCWKYFSSWWVCHFAILNCASIWVLAVDYYGNKTEMLLDCIDEWPPLACCQDIVTYNSTDLLVIGIEHKRDWLRLTIGFEESPFMKHFSFEYPSCWLLVGFINLMIDFVGCNNVTVIFLSFGGIFE